TDRADAAGRRERGRCLQSDETQRGARLERAAGAGRVLVVDPRPVAPAHFGRSGSPQRALSDLLAEQRACLAAQPAGLILCLVIPRESGASSIPKAFVLFDSPVIAGSPAFAGDDDRWVIV